MMDLSLLKWGSIWTLAATFSLQSLNWIEQPVSLTPNDESVYFPQVKVDREGNATVLWGNYSSQIVYSIRKPFSEPWQRLVPDVVGSLNKSVSTSPHLAIDVSTGLASAIWTSTTTGGNSIQATTTTATNVWDGAAHHLSSLSTDSLIDPRLAVDSESRLTAVWTGLQDGIIYSNYHNGVSWGASEVAISGSLEREVREAQVAVDPITGIATATWINVSQGRIEAITQTEPGVWTGAKIQNISKTTLSEVDQAQITADSFGNFAAVWTNFDAQVIQSAYKPAGEEWQSPVNISEKGEVEQPALVADSHGTITAVWYNVAKGTVRAATKPLGGLWRAPRTISGSEVFPLLLHGASPQVAVDTHNNLTAIWTSAGLNRSGTIQSATKPFGSEWEPPHDISVSGQVRAPQLSVDSHGIVNAVWVKTHSTSPNSVIQAVRSGTTIFNLSPSHGSIRGGSSVNINGVGFVGVKYVTVGGKIVNFKVNSPYSLTVTIPPGSAGKSVEIVVATQQFGRATANYTYDVVLPPRDVRGKSIDNRFATQEVYTHQLRWKKSLDRTVVGYEVYRNGDFIAKVSQSLHPSYDDPNRPNQVDLYTIYAVNAQGSKSKGITIEVPQ